MTDQDIINRAKDMCAPGEVILADEWVLRFARIIETHVREECAVTCEKAGAAGYGTLFAAAIIRGQSGEGEDDVQ
jgi:hypothetical protein